MIFTFRKLYWKLIKMTIVFSFCAGSGSILSLFTECAIFGLLTAQCCTKCFGQLDSSGLWVAQRTTHIQQNRTVTVSGSCAKKVAQSRTWQNISFCFAPVFTCFWDAVSAPCLLVLCTASDEGQLVQSAHRCHQLTMLLLLTHFSYSHLLWAALTSD